MKKTLILHAGTHKTASTYIQDRFWVNRHGLKRAGVHLLTPGKKKTGQNIAFAEDLKRHNFDRIGDILSALPPGDEAVLVSAEQITQALVRRNCLEGLLAQLRRHGYQLRVVTYLRDQPEYINSLYIQEVRRFYHSRDLLSYIKRCKKRRRHWFDYEHMFAGLIEHPDVDAQFLPYGTHFGDPFLRFMDSQGWSSPGSQGWLEGNRSKANDQPGIKGVWVALRACRRMDAMGVDRKLLENQSKYIRRYSQPEGWGNDRFFGLRPGKVRRIREFYREGNDRLSQRIWAGRSWSDVFKGLRPQAYSVLDDAAMSDDDLREMEVYVDRVVDDLRRDHPLAFAAVSS